MSEVRYPLANLSGELVWAQDLADQTERPPHLECVGCSERVVLKAGTKNRPHFAHHRATTCTAGETVLHATTIRVLAQALRRAARGGGVYPIDASCAYCHTTRVSNLAIAPDITVTTDQVLDRGIRPDVAVWRNGTAKFVLEVIVTHPPEDAALDLYRDLGLGVAVIWPTWEMLPRLREGLLDELRRTPHSQTGCYDIVSRCRLPRHAAVDPGGLVCRTCAAPAKRINVEVSTTPCWKQTCRATVRVLDLYHPAPEALQLVAASCPDLVDVANLGAQHDVKLEWTHSKQAGGSYLMHLCARCGASQGDNFLYGTQECTPQPTEVVTQMLVCPTGHWEQLKVQPWPAGATVGRPSSAIGRVGEPPGLFTSREPSVRITRVDKHNMAEMTRRMLGTWP